VKQAGIISEEQEEQMWREGILGESNPTQLVNTIVYLTGLQFTLRAVLENINLARNPK